MPSENQLKFVLVQAQLQWRKPADNRAHLEDLMWRHDGAGDVVVLPETFTTGFLGDEGIAENMQGPTLAWMRDQAARLNAVVTGSVVIEDGGRWNRLLWVEPDGSVQHYDKRHLFALGGEDQRYSTGRERQVISYRGWRICPQICYDIRFPVWCRNRDDYDLLLVVANWPSARANAWRSLLQARAIENQSYVVAVNRVGEDGNGKSYPGVSVVFDPLGEPLLELDGREAVAMAGISLNEVQAIRKRLPFHLDADAFDLKS